MFLCRSCRKIDGQIKLCHLLTISEIRKMGYWLLQVTRPESAMESLWPLANQTAGVSPVPLNKSVAQGRVSCWQIYWYNLRTGSSPDWQMTSGFITIFNVNSSQGFHNWRVETWQWFCMWRSVNDSMKSLGLFCFALMFVCGKHIQSSEI